MAVVDVDVETMQADGPRRRRWTTREYYQMAEMGLFEGQRVELIDGEVLQMSPQGLAHVNCVYVIGSKFPSLFSNKVVIRQQFPMDLGDLGLPEPDIAIVEGPADRYLLGHPKTALLIVEVSDSSLSFDRSTKGSLYAKVGIADYWIVNLIDRQVEVHRRPIEDSTAAFGFRFAECQVIKPGDVVSPLRFPEIAIPISEILP